MVSKELSKFIDPVAIITIIVGLSYVMGWIYTFTYFSRFGLQLESLNLPSYFFLSKAIYAVGVLAILIQVVLLILTNLKIDPIEFRKRYFSTSKSWTMLILILLTLSFMGVGYIGDFHATKTIEGEMNEVFIVNFSWNEKTPQELNGKELTLIIHQEGNYYVVNNQKPAPKYPEVYIIPDHQIKFTVVKKKEFHFSFTQIIEPLTNLY